MDLSAIIFVVLALAWAVYLIPKALKHHDELASDRLVEGHSDKVRILSRHGRSTPVEAPVETPVEAPVEQVVDVAEATPARPAAARSAAKRRRRVLYVLLLAAAVVTGLAGFAIVPWWSTAIPGGLVLAFLVIARFSVRAARRRTAAARRAVSEQTASVEPVETHAPVETQAVVETPRPDTGRPETTEALIERLADEDTVGIPRQELEAVLADDGSLWDPLPLTLPTYVNKARARRTVRTIELTGINSSGHDDTDTAIAREAAKTEAEAETEHRRVVGG